MESIGAMERNAARWRALGAEPKVLPPTLTALVLDACERHAERRALADEETSLTYAEALKVAMKAAAIAAKAEGPRVGILLPACKEFGICLFGTLLGGRVALPMNALLSPEALAYVCTDAGLTRVFTCRALRKLAEALPVECVYVEDLANEPPASLAPAQPNPDDTAVLMYTSGTTSKPKGVLLTHRNLIANVTGCVSAMSFGPDDVIHGPLPLFHAFALTTSLLIPVASGAAAVYSARFSPARMLKTAGEHRVTAMMAIPSMFGLALKAYDPDRHDLSALRYCVAGGEALPRATEEAFNARFPVPLLQGYGITEASPVVACNPLAANRPGTAGLPLPNVEAVAVGDDGNPLPAGAEGELWARGDNIMKGYLNRPRATREALAPGGWLRTGDRGLIDADGYVTVTGRQKDLIICGGENIAPAEIEEVLMAHPAVAEAVALPLADDVRGEVPQAFVVLTGNADCTADDLVAHCADALPRFKVPRAIRFRHALPHGPTGKILRRMVE